MTTLPHVVVVGGGASAASLALAFARSGALDALAVTVVDPAPALGRGLAYDAHPVHRLNVPAARMGLHAAEPDGFLKWVRRSEPDADPHAFLPRNLYGRYVVDTLREEVGPRVRHVRDRVATLARLGEGWEVVLDEGATLAADAVVLATGNAAPAHPAGVAPSLRASARYVAAPWHADALAGIGADEDVLVIGTGLTAIDAFLTLRARGHRAPITMMSRRGLLPRPHDDHHGPPAALPDLPPGADLAAWVRLARRAVATAEASVAPWQGVFDALRHRVAGIWAGLSEADRRRFLRHVRPWWDVHRHRVPSDIHARLRAERSEGRVDWFAGALVRAELDGDGVRVTLRRRGRAATEDRRVGHVVNATGPDMDLARSGGPLHRALLEQGWIRQDPHRIGLVTGPDGAAIGSDGAEVPGLYVLGAARRAGAWEATAVPELRVQAAGLAERLARGLVGEAGARA